MALLDEEQAAALAQVAHDIEFRFGQLEAMHVIVVVGTRIRQEEECRALLDQRTRDVTTQHIGRRLSVENPKPVLFADRLLLVFGEIRKDRIAEPLPEFGHHVNEAATVNQVLGPMQQVHRDGRRHLWRAFCRQLTSGLPSGIDDLDPTLQAYAREGEDVSRETLLGALIERGDLGAAVNAFFERHDILICPVYPRVAMPLAEVASTNELFPHFTAWCNQLGLPAASLYAGLTDDQLPIGVQIVGGRHSDALVLWVSHELELALGRAPFAKMARALSASVAGGERMI
ncbi:hypothetical protein DIE00_36285 [Burkholderia sp. Bp8989]|nr:hypothetical protein DIE05_36540 [Burkholderia sp. Bp8995]RQS38372.1 hypothetical protein DIE00_36285 [Burkholderia sp. Bp8989]